MEALALRMSGYMVLISFGDTKVPNIRNKSPPNLGPRCESDSGRGVNCQCLWSVRTASEFQSPKATNLQYGLQASLAFFHENPGVFETSFSVCHVRVMTKVAMQFRVTFSLDRKGFDRFILARPWLRLGGEPKRKRSPD